MGDVGPRIKKNIKRALLQIHQQVKLFRSNYVQNLLFYFFTFIVHFISFFLMCSNFIFFTLKWMEAIMHFVKEFTYSEMSNNSTKPMFPNLKQGR